MDSLCVLLLEDLLDYARYDYIGMAETLRVIDVNGLQCFSYYKDDGDCE